MKHTTRGFGRRLLLMLMCFALVFANVEEALAIEITELGISAEYNNAAEKTDFVCGNEDYVVVADVEIDKGELDSESETTIVSEEPVESEKIEETKEVDEPEEKEIENQELQKEDEEFSIPAGVWSDREPFFTDDVPAQSGGTSKLFRMVRASSIIPTYKEVYDRIIALKSSYPEGMTFTNYEPFGKKGPYENYRFKGGAIKGAAYGVGCAAFGFLASDEGFGDLPARTIDKGNFNYEDIKVGDILRVNHNSHFVIVLQVSVGGVIVAEANYNKTVHWGRAISANDIMEADFLVTRWPVGYSEENNNDEIAYSGTEGSLSWALTNAGVLTISGEGPMLDYGISNRPAWNNYADRINTIVIEEGVTTVGSYSFYESNVLTAYIPEGVKKIGNGAFQGSKLVSATIPGTVLNVGDDAFRSCENLTSVSISDGIETIGNNAFRACRALTYIDFPASIKTVGTGAFMSCDYVVQIRFAPGTGNVAIGDSAFAQCQRLVSVTLPYKLTKISNYMFQSCTSLWGIYISKNVTDIGENPFTSTGIQYGGTIYFGGSSTTWRSIGGQFILNAMPYADIQYNVEFDDPFAVDPNDPGDFHPDETGDETKPDDGSETGGETKPDDGSETGGETKPDDGSETGGETKPDDGSETGGETKPDDGSEVGGETKPGDESVSGNVSKPGNGSGIRPGSSTNTGSGTKPGSGTNIVSSTNPTVTLASAVTQTLAMTLTPVMKRTLTVTRTPVATLISEVMKLTLITAMSK